MVLFPHISSFSTTVKTARLSQTINTCGTIIFQEKRILIPRKILLVASFVATERDKTTIYNFMWLESMNETGGGRNFRIALCVILNPRKFLAKSHIFDLTFFY